MYTVVIIDDERVIAEDISRAVLWEKYDFRVVGIARRGDEGTGILKERRPDVLFFAISDEEAAGTDSLAMVAAMRVEFPGMMIGVLSRFWDSALEQSLTRLGVVCCLRKPFCQEELLEALAEMIKRLRQTENTGAGAGGFIVKKALSYIEQNYREHLTLGEVAENTYVSQWHLSKLLNRHTGRNFSELLNHVRIGHAKELLRGSTLRIGEIAEAVGFVDIAHFSRVFKKMEGISANEYRNKRI